MRNIARPSIIFVFAHEKRGRKWIWLRVRPERAHSESVELRHLRSFLAVADCLSFSQAAVELHITQPALSRQIRQLEDELGCRLFERRPTEILLTAEGKYLCERAATIVQLADALVRELQARGQGRHHT